MAEERTQCRLAAIPAGDVFGYTRLVEQDEAGTMTVLGERRRAILGPLFTKYRGRVIRLRATVPWPSSRARLMRCNVRSIFNEFISCAVADPAGRVEFGAGCPSYYWKGPGSMKSRSYDAIRSAHL